MAQMLASPPRNTLYTRLAASREDVEAAQRLRFDVFYRERNWASYSDGNRDEDRFDAISDHLLVFRQVSAAGPGTDDELVGTYRLLRQDVATRHGGFYSQQEFDLSPLLARHKALRFLELGRSCVLAPYRSMPVIGLLWQGIWDYVRSHGIDVMIGCASLEGTDVEKHRAVLNFLGLHLKAPPDWNASVHPHSHAHMPDDSGATLDLRRVLRALPPLVRGYMGLGCYVGEGVYVDHAFNTIDILIILPVSRINPRYFAHFGAPTSPSPADVKGRNGSKVDDVIGGGRH